MTPPGELVLDTGPLSHLTKAGWLGVLRSVAGARTVVIPDAVEQELRQGTPANIHLALILEAQWIVRAPLSSDDEQQAFAHFSSFLVEGMRNVGEAAVRAYAQVHAATAIIDDSSARHAAQSAGNLGEGARRSLTLTSSRPPTAEVR